jgi:hypothetical protein
MFESLDERIKIDESSTPKERMIRYGGIGIISIVVIAGIYAVVHYFG